MLIESSWQCLGQIGLGTRLCLGHDTLGPRRCLSSFFLSLAGLNSRKPLVHKHCAYTAENGRIDASATLL